MGAADKEADSGLGRAEGDLEHPEAAEVGWRAEVGGAEDCGGY